VKINTRVTTDWNPGKVKAALLQGIGGYPVPAVAIVGPTYQAWYGRLHEYGVGRFPARPFMRPALHKTQAAFALLFKNIMLGAGIPALRKAAALVERAAKESMKKGGQVSATGGTTIRQRNRGKRVQVPSTPPAPPHVQTGNLRNSIKYAVVPIGA